MSETWNKKARNSRQKSSILGWKKDSLHKKLSPSEPGSDFWKFSEKLVEVQQLTETVQKCFLTYQDRASVLSKRNEAIMKENSRLKEKIKGIAGLKHQPKPIRVFSPSNTSLPTQETEVFQSKQSSFSVSSCSSIDSIGVLKDQVDHIKEFHHVKKSDKKITMHKKTNSIDQCENPQKKHLGYQNGIVDRYLGKQTDLATNKSMKQKLLVNALVCNIVVLRFN